MTVNVWQVTFETQEEIDKLYTLTNYTPICRSIDLSYLRDKLHSICSMGYQNYHRKLASDLRGHFERTIDYERKQKQIDEKIAKNKTKRKEGRRMIKKALHRITVVWCLYGLARFCILINPLLIRLFKLVGLGESFYGLDEWGDIAMMWFLTLCGVAVLVFIGIAIHHFANWFFNTKK